MSFWISIHAPHARSDCRSTSGLRRQRISIHAPHARSDWHHKGVDAERIKRFQSTLLMRGATRLARQSCNINPFQSTLLMRGATRHGWERKGEGTKFQSTLLMRGATRVRKLTKAELEFQSTLLMRGATRCSSHYRCKIPYFNPRSSCEERQAGPDFWPEHPGHFNPRSSCEERLQ